MSIPLSFKHWKWRHGRHTFMISNQAPMGWPMGVLGSKDPVFESLKAIITQLYYSLKTLAFLFMMWRGDGSYTIFFAFFAHFFPCWKKTFDSFFFVNVWQLDNIYYTYNALYISYYIWYNTSRCVFFCSLVLQSAFSMMPKYNV